MSNEIIQHENTSTMLLDTNAIESYKDMAKLMAQSQVQLPDHFKGKPADCLAVVLQAAQWRMNPFVVAQKTHVINGQLGYEAQLVNAVVSSSNAIKGRFHYEYQGDRNDWKPTWKKEKNQYGKDVWKPEFSENACLRVGAILAGESEITWGEWVYPCDQTVFNSPLWKSNPKQQAGYLAVKFWARFYTPDVLLGVYTPDDLQDGSQAKDITPKNVQKQHSLLSKIGKKKEPEPELEMSPETELEMSPETELEMSPETELEMSPEQAAFGEWLFFINSCEESKPIAAEMPRLLNDKRLTEEQKSHLSDAAAQKISQLKGHK